MFLNQLSCAFKYPNQTAEEFEADANLAVHSSSIIRGVKGRSPLLNLIRIPEQVPFDYMHLVLQGHTKWLLRQLFFFRQRS
jgi:hypothetical protein